MALRTQHVVPELLNKVTKALGITALDQWYYVSQHKATKVIGSRALNKYGGNLSSFLKHAYPQHQFDEEKLASTKNLEKDQRFVEVIIRKLFPNEEIHTKARKAVGIVNPETGAYLEIDFWIPSLKLGIEYQDKHHYGYQWYANDALETYQKRDDIKKTTMLSFGYTLITIGHWWDKSIDSLAATIKQYRPDLLHDYNTISTEPISPDPPSGYFDEFPVIPGVGGIMSPFVPRTSFNPTNWYGGEKHDGIRGVFNPKLNKMFSRSGNELSIHSSLLKDIPHMLVEGEIIAGRGNYNKTAAVSYHTHHDKVNWPLFRYVVFDVPDAELGNYTQRYSVVTNGLLEHPYIFAQPAFRVFLVSKAHLKMLMDTIINDAGEGVIAQQDAPYEYGRASTLAKLKVHRDADAIVLHVNKFSCTCKLVSGITVDINFGTNFNPSNLKEGDIISYYHHGYTNSGLPKRGEVYKVRFDVTWEDLVRDKEQNAVTKRRSFKEALGSESLIARITTQHKKGYWNKAPNVRAFFDEFARASGFDPFVAENWYNVRFSKLQNAGSAGLLNAYGYSLHSALSYAYPELAFEAARFKTRDKTKERRKNRYWRKTSNVRAFFDEFARTSGFDPLVAENWYPVRGTSLRNVGGVGLLYAFGYNLKNALSCAYPEVKFDGKFRQPKVKQGHWEDPLNSRAFFDDFARTSGFDPLVPDNWYPVRITTLRNAKAGVMLNAYGHNLRKALTSAYPELTFEPKKFLTRAKTKERNKMGHWHEPRNLRVFFDEFARKYRFDSLVAKNWYQVKVSNLRDSGGSGLLGSYRYQVQHPLSLAYPELKFDKGKFETHAIKGHWNKPEDVRAFFDEFAQTSRFDPLVPENWNAVKNSSLQIAKGSGLLKAYGYDLKQALSFGYPELQFE